jgi:hypothetical protein
MWNPVRFYRESRAFTKGYSNWWFFTHLPRAFFNFYYSSLMDTIRYKAYLSDLANAKDENHDER